MRPEGSDLSRKVCDDGVALDEGAIRALFEETAEFYRRHGIAGRVGFGRRPAVLVIDMMTAFTSGASPIGSDLSDVVAANRRLLDVARAGGVPVVFTTMGYRPDLADAGVWVDKFPSLRDLRIDGGGVDVDPRLAVGPQDFVIRKDYPSAFHGTSLLSILVPRRVDTIVVTGTTTSGCVRATAVDALSHGYRVIVPRECVGDRAPLPHIANLFDIDAKYGDVVALEEVLRAIEGVSALGTGDR